MSESESPIKISRRDILKGAASGTLAALGLGKRDVQAAQSFQAQTLSSAHEIQPRRPRFINSSGEPVDPATSMSEQNRDPYRIMEDSGSIHHQPSHDQRGIEAENAYVTSMETDIPKSVAEIFTSDPKEVNSMKYANIEFMTAYDDGVGIKAILNVTPDGSSEMPARFQLAQYDISSGKFSDFETIGNAPMSDCSSVTLMPGKTDKSYDVLVGVTEGQSQFDPNGFSTIPRLFYGSLEGKDYQEIELIDQSGDKLSHGTVIDVKRIPKSRIALVQVILPNLETGYGIFDPESKTYVPVSGEGALPVLDDICTSADGVTMMGTGRVLERDKGGFQQLKAVSNLELDLRTYSVKQDIIFQNTDNISMRSLNVKRDNDGTPLVAYGVQKNTGDRENGRHFYEIDLKSGDVKSQDYGPFLDQSVLKVVKPEMFMPKEYFVGSYPVVNGILPREGGNLFFGQIQIPTSGAHPMIAFVPEGIDPVDNWGDIIVNPFNEVRVFPGDISQVLEGSFPNGQPFQSQSDSNSSRGYLLNMHACGQAIVPSDEKGVPAGETAMFAIKSHPLEF